MRPLRADEYWDLERRRMIAETEAFLNRYLAEPWRAPTIPSIQVGRGHFSAAFSARYWQHVLFEAEWS